MTSPVTNKGELKDADEAPNLVKIAGRVRLNMFIFILFLNENNFKCNLKKQIENLIRV